MPIGVPLHFVGVVLAVTTAAAWAVQYVLIRIGTQRGRVSDAVLVALAANVAIVAPTAVVLYYPDYGLTTTAVVGFAAAGVSGSWLSRAFQFRSVRAIGASRTSPVVSAAALISAILASVILGETLTPLHVIGTILVVFGVAVLSQESTPAGDRASSTDAQWPLLLPLLAALFLGVEPIFVKIGLAEGTPRLVGLAIMVSAATAGFVGARLVRGDIPRWSTMDASSLRWFVGAGIATTIALLAYLAALEAAPVVVVIPIVQAAPLLVVTLSFAFLPRQLERVTWRLAVGAAVTVLGAAIVSVAT